MQCCHNFKIFDLLKLLDVFTDIQNVHFNAKKFKLLPCVDPGLAVCRLGLLNEGRKFEVWF
jgi:molybdopterin/thiamine biosynthesis adenylyltransferase